MDILAAPAYRVVWCNVWKSYREEKIDFFLWCLVHRINATKHYIGRHSIRHYEAGLIVPFSHRNYEWWCGRYVNDAHEDIQHCQWSCQDSQRTWVWIAKVFGVASRLDSVSISFG